MGDTYIRTITLLEFPKIFGRENYFLNNLLVDHANSNLFFEAVTIHYKLETRVKLPPRNWMGNKDKLTADIFEAWIGGHIYERMQYDDKDPLDELRYFLNRLWSIRYSRLRQYRHNTTTNLAHIPSHSIQKPIISPIISHSDSELKRTLAAFLEAPNNQNREIGYHVQVDNHTSFATSEMEANQMADLRLWTSPGIRPFTSSPVSN